jgi:hypothetical protein
MPKSQLNDDGSRCGSRTNPWIIEAQTGQRISISLLDFGPQQRRPEDGATSQTVAVERLQPGLENCTMSYGYIVEKAATNKRNTTICSNGAGDLRDRFVYQSTGSAIEMVLSSTQSSGAESFQNKFLVGFKGQ